jgi:hypothetical protein
VRRASACSSRRAAGRCAPARLALGALLVGDGGAGFALDGIDPRDYAGTAVSVAGDVDGDGLDDLIIAAPDAEP